MALLLLHLFTITTWLSILRIPLLASALSFNYSSFSPLSDDNITYQRAYPDSNRMIQLPPNPETAGRATYNKPMHLWDKTTRNLADFTTHFSFVIDSQKRTICADGLAFFLAPQGAPATANDDKGGGSLGLTKDIEPLNSSVPFFAVEFDIFNNAWDPPPTHVGTDINTLESVNTVTWWSDVGGARRNEAWINYNSSTHNLSVAFTGFRENTTVIQYLNYQVDLRLHLPEYVTLGFSMATGSAYAVFSIYSWYTNPVLPPRRRGKNRTILVVGLSLGGGVLIGVLALIIWVTGFGRKRYDEDDNEGNNQGLNEYVNYEFELSGPRKYSYKKLSQATNNFSDEQKLGQGGFGGVYKGFSGETNAYVAVKRVSKGSKQGIKEYASEVKVISRLRHRNLVQLLGWCHEKNELLLVYEFMPNGSLDSHLFEENRFLTWELRYKIAQDLAAGLLYLQEEWDQCVLHRDIKSSNIMLDSNFKAKIGDFGLARLVEHSKGSETTILAGTLGYMAPECAMSGKASKESDVYCFGIVVLEIACGRKSINHTMAKQGNVSLLQWVWELYGNGKLLQGADPRLCGEFDEQEVERLMMVGLWCAHPDESLRGSMREAIRVLNFEAPLPILPPKMPVPTFLYPLVGMLIIDGIDSKGRTM
ncbi:hypothetical protein KPL70_013854 [Citrus sinensis]|nr:hypothetical protein KPL70_013854 [Citrus sinensis]